MRTATQSGLRVLVATVASSVAACEWIPLLPDAELVRVERALSLEIAHVVRRKSDTATFTFTLRNHSTEITSACLGPGRAVSYTSSATSGVSMTLVDHPGCINEFTIERGSDWTWTEELEFSAAFEGGLELQVDVQIVNPRTCGASGCSAITLPSNTYVIPGSGPATLGCS